MRKLNEDWSPGDLAVCIADDWNPLVSCDPKRGDILRVAKVRDGVGRHGSDEARHYMLVFQGNPHNAYECAAFQKLRPEIEPASDEFIAELKSRLGMPA